MSQRCWFGMQLEKPTDISFIVECGVETRDFGYTYFEQGALGATAIYTLT